MSMLIRGNEKLMVTFILLAACLLALSTCDRLPPAYACDQFPIPGPEQQVGDPRDQADGLVIVEFDRDGDGVIDHALFFQRGDTGTMLQWPLIYAYGIKGAHRLYVDRGSPHPAGRCQDIQPLGRTYTPREQA